MAIVRFNELQTYPFNQSATEFERLNNSSHIFQISAFRPEFLFDIVNKVLNIYIYINAHYHLIRIAHSGLKDSHSLSVTYSLFSLISLHEPCYCENILS